MTPQELARVHAAAFVQGRPWTQAEFAALLSSPHVALTTRPGGFALTRTVAGESELLTIAVDPSCQRKGIASALMHDWLEGIEADSAFLEVAADNHPARALYEAFQFTEVGQRPAYYLRKDAPSVDALVLRRDLTLGQGHDSRTTHTESG